LKRQKIPNFGTRYSKDLNEIKINLENVIVLAPYSKQMIQYACVKNLEMHLLGPLVIAGYIVNVKNALEMT
jgi:hypothetical protein